MKKTTILIFVLTSIIFAQETSYIEILKSDINTQRRVLITTAMEFSEEEAQKFWPIYKDFEIEYDKLMDMEIKLIKDYAESYENMTEAVANQLVKQSFKIDRDQITLKEDYFKKFGKELGTVRSVKLIQVINRIDLMISLQKAARIPVLN